MSIINGKRMVSIQVVPNVDREELHEEDQSLDDFYDVEVDADLPEHLIANAALDAFHGSVAVKVPDDFDFDVFYLGKLIYQNPSQESYTLEHRAKLV